MADFSCNYNLSRSRIPVAWECGGSSSNTGACTIWCSPDGGKKKAFIVRSSGHLSNGEHALVPVNYGDYRIDVDHAGDDLAITIFMVDRILVPAPAEGDKATIFFKEVANFSLGEWDHEVPHLAAAIDAAVNKCYCYHCRNAYWVIPPSKRY